MTFLLHISSCARLSLSQLPHTLDLTWFDHPEDWRLPDPVRHTFKEFSYFETRKNEALFREYWKACEQSPSCWSEQISDAVSQSNCVRQCIAPSCYNEIYGEDALEEGEIDVRLNSFKGCFHERLQRRRNY